MTVKPVNINFLVTVKKKLNKRGKKNVKCKIKVSLDRTSCTLAL